MVDTHYHNGQDFHFQKVYLHNSDEGNLSLEEIEVPGSKKVVIMLHGITGSSWDKYMVEMTGAFKENGFNCICFNHYAPENEKDLRLMNMCNDKYLDEVIEYAC